MSDIIIIQNIDANFGMANNWVRSPSAFEQIISSYPLPVMSDPRVFRRRVPIITESLTASARPTRNTPAEIE